MGASISQQPSQEQIRANALAAGFDNEQVDAVFDLMENYPNAKTQEEKSQVMVSDA